MGKEKYEDALARLEQIVGRMNAGDQPLEEMLKAFEEGIRLARFCAKKLDEAERKVQLILKEDDQYALKPFREDDLDG